MGKTIIVTSGPTNERIDAVMKITNMSTGALGACVVETMLGGQDGSSVYAEYVDKIYYLSTKLSRKPIVPDGQAHKINEVQVESTDDLLNTLRVLLKNPDEHIDAVVHSAAVGDYKSRYAARAEDIAAEIVRRNEQDGTLSYEEILSILEHPECVQNDSTKISSYEPNLMVMLDLTPKVISSIKEFSPDTLLIGFKLLEGVSDEELFSVASKLRRKNNADFIVANDLAKIGNGKHPAMIIGVNNVLPDWDIIVSQCETKAEIAQEISNIIFPGACPSHETE